MSRPARRRTTRIAWTRYCTATWISPVVCCGKSTKHEGTPARVSESCNPAGHASLPSTPVPVTKSTGVRAALVTDSWQNSDDRNLSEFTPSPGSRASAVDESAPSAHSAKERTTKRLIGVIIGPRGASATRRSQVLGDLQRREFRQALLEAASFEDLPGKWQAANSNNAAERPGGVLPGTSGTRPRRRGDVDARRRWAPAPPPSSWRQSRTGRKLPLVSGD